MSGQFSEIFSNIITRGGRAREESLPRDVLNHVLRFERLLCVMWGINSCFSSSTADTLFGGHSHVAMC